MTERNLQAGVKEAKLRAKQVQEMEVLQARGAKGKEQLKRAHAQVIGMALHSQLLGHAGAGAVEIVPWASL